MNETIGIKGGTNDRKRRMIITKKELKKLKEYQTEKEIKELEDKNRLHQIQNIAITVPIVIAGAIIENNDIVRKKEQIDIPLKETNITSKEEIEKLKNYEIIDRYEQKLKDIKYELKNIIFEYNIIAKAGEEIYESVAAEELIQKLNIIIKRLEILKKLLDIPNKVDYDQNYIYELITEYINDFDQNRLVSDIKDSELYIYISNKLMELDEKKDKLNDSLYERKEEIKIDEEALEKIKDEYDLFDNFNNKLLRFQSDQELLIKDLEEKIAKATTEEERIETRIRFLTDTTHVIMDLIAPQVIIPGVRSATRIAIAAASLTHIIRNHLRPRRETTRYRVINTIDYYKDISNSISDIEKALTLLDKSKKQLELTLKEFKDNYNDYLGKVKEFDKVLENLELVLESLTEKEEEMKRLKEEQEKNLEHNNEKVKTIRNIEIREED